MTARAEFHLGLYSMVRTTPFVMRFLLFFLLLAGLFQLGRDTAFEALLVERGLVRPAAMGLNLLDDQAPVAAEGRVLRNGSVSMRVVRGCDGIETWCLLAAALLAWPAAAGQRAAGLVLGTAIVVGLGVLRLMALFLALDAWPAAFGLLHGLVLPLSMVALVAVFFAAWARNTRLARG